jgi:hypothetical protein
MKLFNMEARDLIGFAALLLSITSLVITYFSGRQRDIREIRPILVFEYRKEGWHVHNIGSGPAMDVVFTRFEKENVHSHTRLPSLTKDAVFPLHFCKHDNAHRFVATYQDFEGRLYSSESVHDVSRTIAGHLVERPSKPVEQWWKLPERDQ